MQIESNIKVHTQPVTNFNTLLQYAEGVASVEGKDLYKHVAKMGTAAGDLAATATNDFEQSKDHTYDEVAGLVLRGVIFGIAHGMTARDLQEALGREAGRLVQEGVEKRVQDNLNAANFATPAQILGATACVGCGH